MPCTGFIPKAARAVRNPRVNRSGSRISPSPLSSAQTAADEQRFASDPGGLRGGQEDGGRRDIVRLTDAAERRLRLDLFPKLAGGEPGGMQAFRLYHPGVDRIHADVARPAPWRGSG